jgi:hypothetical protein
MNCNIISVLLKYFQGLRLMYQNMSTLSELKHKQTNLQQQILELKSDMEIFNVKCPLILFVVTTLRSLSFLLCHAGMCGQGSSGVFATVSRPDSWQTSSNQT